jgi:hypothetical protein
MRIRKSELVESQMMEWLSAHQEILVGIKGSRISTHPIFLYSKSQQTSLQYPAGRQDFRIMRLLLCRRGVKLFIQKIQDVH